MPFVTFVASCGNRIRTMIIDPWPLTFAKTLIVKSCQTSLGSDIEADGPWEDFFALWLLRLCSLPCLLEFGWLFIPQSCSCVLHLPRKLAVLLRSQAQSALKEGLVGLWSRWLWTHSWLHEAEQLRSAQSTAPSAVPWLKGGSDMWRGGVLAKPEQGHRSSSRFWICWLTSLWNLARWSWSVWRTKRLRSQVHPLSQDPRSLFCHVLSSWSSCNGLGWWVYAGTSI